MQFYTTEALGRSQKLTPEGFLIVEGAPLARTGMQLYSEKEIPLTGDADGHIIVQRDPEEVFHPNMIASLNGKPITLDHPKENITPDNWRDLSVGYVINPRRGQGLNDNLLLGDLIITHPKAIQAVRDGDLRELSVGYDSAYEQTGPGRGRQHNIIANHLAIIESGRCGPVCRIGDSAGVELLKRASESAGGQDTSGMVPRDRFILIRPPTKRPYTQKPPARKPFHVYLHR